MAKLFRRPPAQSRSALRGIKWHRPKHYLTPARNSDGEFSALNLFTGLDAFASVRRSDSGRGTVKIKNQVNMLKTKGKIFSNRDSPAFFSSMIVMD